MIRLNNFIEYIIKVTAIIFLSSEISLADFDNGMDAIKKDKIYSLMWFMLASATDDKQALENRDIIIQELSDNEVKLL